MKKKTILRTFIFICLAVIVGSCGKIKNDFEVETFSSDFEIYDIKGRSCKNQVDPPTSGDSNDLTSKVMPVGRLGLRWDEQFPMELQSITFRFYVSQTGNTKSRVFEKKIYGQELAMFWNGNATTGTAIIPARSHDVTSNSKCSLEIGQITELTEKDAGSTGYGEIIFAGRMSDGSKSEPVYSTTSFNWSFPSP